MKDSAFATYARDGTNRAYKPYARLNSEKTPFRDTRDATTLLHTPRTPLHQKKTKNHLKHQQQKQDKKKNLAAKTAQRNAFNQHPRYQQKSVRTRRQKKPPQPQR
ncbi:hypothetical protein D6783_04265 [Candidatus Woesearchaeota archaeon]|nr:MAG: hypothetical protein D6783_04265 [Candidatus Woesearchaeota archaeon]